MILKKTTLTLALTGTLFFALPMTHAFADEAKCEIKDTELGDTMKYMKSELRAYKKALNSEDQAGMQEHAGELVKLSDRGVEFIPVLISRENKAEKVADLTTEQKAEFVKYQQAMKDLNSTFKTLSETTDKAEIEAILVKVEEQDKQGHKQFRLKCKK